MNVKNVKKWLIPINGLIKKFPNVYQFCNEDTNKFVLLLQKVFNHTNTWTAGKDLMKDHYQIKCFLQRIISRKHY